MELFCQGWDLQGVWCERDGQVPPCMVGWGIRYAWLHNGGILAIVIRELYLHPVVLHADYEI